MLSLSSFNVLFEITILEKISVPKTKIIENNGTSIELFIFRKRGIKKSCTILKTTLLDIVRVSPILHICESFSDSPMVSTEYWSVENTRMNFRPEKITSMLTKLGILSIRNLKPVKK